MMIHVTPKRLKKIVVEATFENKGITFVRFRNVFKNKGNTFVKLRNTFENKGNTN